MVSIIVPVCNVEKYVEECLRSIMRQSLKDIEIIVVDDGSTDSSGEIVDRLAREDSRIRVYHNENHGYGHAVNYGIDRARGEYLGIIESDDSVSEEMYERLLKKAVDNDADVVKSDFYYVGRWRKRKLGIFQGMTVEKLTTPAENPELFHIPHSVWSALYRRQFLVKNQIRFLETPGASYQDNAFSYKIWAMAKRIVLTEEAFVFYRADNENSSVHSSKKVFCVCDEVEEMRRYAKAYGLEGFAGRMLYTAMYHAYRWNYFRLGAEARREFYGRMTEELRQIDIREIREAEWRTEYLSELKRILEDNEGFFRETSREMQQQEIDKESRKGELLRKAVLGYIAGQEKILIHGAGLYGERVLDWLREQGFSERLLGFSVSEEGESKKKEGYPIRALSDYERDALVIISVKDMEAQLSILKSARAMGFTELLSWGDVLNIS